jgi:urease accessory protein
MKKFAEDFANELPAGTPTKAPCQATLSLGFADDAGTTRLIERSHFGPLRVQKPLYPEGHEVCHAIVVHPPGGVVGGDELTISTHVGAHSHAFITTPGAAKWYKANGHVSRQNIQMNVEQNASLEWLPQETIFFDTAHVQLDNDITLGKDATYLGCEILCFGRTASGESFNAGKITQRNTIRREGKLIWFEQGAITGGSNSMSSPLALAGNTVCATLIAAGKALTPSSINAMREAADVIKEKNGAFGITQMKSVLVVRYLGNSSEVARQVVTQAWQQLRPEMLRREGVIPRIWNT